MKYLLLMLLTLSFSSYSIVIRHDVQDEQYKVSKSTLPQLATFYFDGAHGTLIKPDWVLTAAHATFCVSSKHPILINDRLVSVKRVFVHKDYTPGKSHDIALIQLENPVEGVTPMSLNPDKNELGKRLWFIGIGGTGNGLTGETIKNYENNGQMRKAQNEVSYAEGPLLKFVFDKDETALPLEGVSGGGDSGGPAYTFSNGKGTLYGISSRFENGSIGKYGIQEVYSRTSYFTDWIDQIIRGEKVDQIAYKKLQRLPAGLTSEILPQVCEDISIRP